MDLSKVFDDKPIEIFETLINGSLKMNRYQTQKKTSDLIQSKQCYLIDENENKNFNTPDENFVAYDEKLFNEIKEKYAFWITEESRKDVPSLAYYQYRSCQYKELINHKNIDQLEKIGEYQYASNGVFFLKFKNEEKIAFACKFPDPSIETLWSFTQENLIGLQVINEGRKFLPNFAYTYGMKTCDLFQENYCGLNILRDEEYKKYAPVIFMEYIENMISLSDWLDNNIEDFTKNLRSTFLQIFNALDLLKSLTSVFHHGDLHESNIFIKKLDHYTYIPIYHFNEGLLVHIEYLLTKYIVYIIDFEYSVILDYVTMVRLLNEYKTSEYEGRNSEEIKRLFMTNYLFLGKKQENIHDVIRIFEALKRDIFRAKKKDPENQKFRGIEIIFEQVFAYISNTPYIPNENLDYYSKYQNKNKETIKERKTYGDMLRFFKTDTLSVYSSDPILLTPSQIYSDSRLSKIENTICQNEKCYISLERDIKFNQNLFYPINVTLIKEFFKNRKQEIHDLLDQLSSYRGQRQSSSLSIQVNYYRAFKTYMKNEKDCILYIFLDKKDEYNPTILTVQYPRETNVSKLYRDFEYLLHMSGFKHFSIELIKTEGNIILNKENQDNLALEDKDMIKIFIWK